MGAAFWIAAFVTYLVLEAVAAAGFGGQYSYARNFISELGAPIYSPLAYLMNTALFLQPALFLGGAVLLVRADLCRKPWLFLFLASVHAVGTILVGAAHDGSPEKITVNAWVHYIGVHLAILGGNAAVMAGAITIPKLGAPTWYRRISLALGAFGLLCFALLVISTKVPDETIIVPAATWERGSVYTIIVWQTLAACLLLARTRMESRGFANPGELYASGYAGGRHRLDNRQRSR